MTNTKCVLEQELEEIEKRVDGVYIHGTRNSTQTIDLPEDETTIAEAVTYAKNAILRVVEAALEESRKEGSMNKHLGYANYPEYIEDPIIDYWNDGKLYTFTKNQLYVFDGEAQYWFPSNVYRKLIKRRLKAVWYSIKMLGHSLWIAWKALFNPQP